MLIKIGKNKNRFEAPNKINKYSRIEHNKGHIPPKIWEFVKNHGVCVCVFIY
jgi:hypothetical protein